MGKATKLQLEQWNAALKEENEHLHKQMNERLEDSAEYQTLARQLQDETNLKKLAYEQLEKYRARCQRLEDEKIEQTREYAKLQEAYNTLLSAHNALTNDLDTVRANLEEELQQFKVAPHNARGAGRKPVLTDAQRDEVRQLHTQGKSLRQIAAQMGVTHTAIAKILKVETN